MVATHPQSICLQVDNSNTPFVPILTEKPHAIVPLEKSIARPGDCGDGGGDGPSDAMHAHISAMGLAPDAAADIAAASPHPYRAGTRQRTGWISFFGF